MSFTKGKWKNVKTSGDIPLGRSSHSLTVVEHKAFVIGGENTPRIPIGSDVYCLDLQTYVWKLCIPCSGDIPVPRFAHTSTAVLGKIYVFGGRTEVLKDEENLNDLYEFDTKKYSWKHLKPTDGVPDSRSYHAMASNSSSLYIFGGCSETGRRNDLWEYIINTNRWRKLKTNGDIEGRGGAGLEVIKDLFVVAGFAGRQLSDVFRLNLKTMDWARLQFDKDLPPRSVFGITTVGTSIFVLFGEIAHDTSENGYENAGEFSDECYLLDTQCTTAGWRKLSTVDIAPGPRGWLDVATDMNSDGEHVIVVFGGNTQANVRVNDTHLMELIV